MKSTKTIKRLAAIFSSALLLLAVSCKNGLEPETANVKFSVSEDARTILPQINVSDFTDLELSEKGESKNTLLGSYSTLEELTDAELEMTPGDYTFILTANDNGTTLSGTTAITIVKGDNTVSFNMQISDYGTEDGSVEITLIVPTTDDLLEAQYEFVNVDDDSIYYDATIGDQTISNEAGTSSIPFSVSAVKPGTYQLKLTYYIDTDNYVTYSTIVRVSAGAVSKGEFECKGIVNNPVEWPEILDLQNSFENSDEEDSSRRVQVGNIAKGYKNQFTASYCRNMHKGFIDDSNKITTMPVTNKKLLEVADAVNQPEFTDAEIASLFKFEPVEDGIRVTFSLPDTAKNMEKYDHTIIRLMYVDGDIPEDGSYYGTTDEYSRTHQLSTKQEITIWANEDSSKTWVYPLLDPTRSRSKVRFLTQVQVYITNETYAPLFQTLYDCYYGGGVGCIKDLPHMDSNKVFEKNYVEFKFVDGKYEFIGTNINVPKSTDTYTIYDTKTSFSLWGSTVNNEYYAKDSENNLYSWQGTVDSSTTDGSFTHVINFDDYLYFKARKITEPYIWGTLSYTYKIQGYEGTFSTPTVSSQIIANDQYFNLDPTTKTYPEYFEITNSIDNTMTITYDLLEPLKDYAMIINVTHSATNNDGEWGGIGYGYDNYYKDYYTNEAMSDTQSFIIGDFIEEGKKLNTSALAMNFSDSTSYSYRIFVSKRSTDIATVSFGNYDKESFKVCTGVDITNKLPELTSTDKDNPFVEWYTDEDCTKKFTGTVTGDTTLYYKWTNTKDIKYLLNEYNHLYKDDLTPYEGMSLKYTVHHPASTSPTWAGFLGWNWNDYFETNTDAETETTLTYTHTIAEILAKDCLKDNNNKEFYNFNLCNAWTIESLIIIKK